MFNQICWLGRNEGLTTYLQKDSIVKVTTLVWVGIISNNLKLLKSPHGWNVENLIFLGGVSLHHLHCRPTELLLNQNVYLLVWAFICRKASKNNQHHYKYASISILSTFLSKYKTLKINVFTVQRSVPEVPKNSIFLLHLFFGITTVLFTQPPGGRKRKTSLSLCHHSCSPSLVFLYTQQVFSFSI